MSTNVTYMNIKDARPNISKMVDRVNDFPPTTYVIGVRNKPRALLVDLNTAKKYLPSKLYKYSEEPAKTGGQLFCEGMMEILKDPPKFKGDDVKHLSDNIDKIVYEH